MTEKKRIDWKIVVEKSEEICKAAIRQTGTPESMRGLFYVLTGEGLLPLTKNAYKGLSKVLSKKRYSGEFDWNLILDRSRPHEETEQSQYSPNEYDEEQLLRKLVDIHKFAGSFKLNPFLDQPYRIVIAVEKDTIFPKVLSALERVWNHGVFSVRVLRGYTSATSIFELVEALGRLEENQQPVVLLLGDFDPSGLDIERDFGERLSMLYGQEVIVERVGVTKEQIEELGLPHRPEDSEEIAKLERDPRFKKYEHGFFRVEIDSLLALHWERFLEVLQEKLEGYWDSEIYETVTAKREEEMQEESETCRKNTFELVCSMVTDEVAEKLRELNGDKE